MQMCRIPCVISGPEFTPELCRSVCRITSVSGSCVHLYTLNVNCGVLWKCRSSAVQKCAESPVVGGSWLQGAEGWMVRTSVCWPVLAGEDGGGRLGQ